MPAALDAIDIKILDLMQRDASLSTGELAERVGLSQSPCWRRIQRLREEGYIKAVVAIVDHEMVGFKMQIFAQVKMTTLTEEERANFYKAINSIPEILECWTVFGEMDAMMKILAPDRLIVGDPETCVREFHRWREATGADYFLLRLRHAHSGGPPHARIMEAIRLFGDKVLPHCR